MKSLIVLNSYYFIIISILLFFLCISIILFIKQYKIESESKRLIKESERLSQLNAQDDEKPYEDFTSGHIY